MAQGTDASLLHNQMAVYAQTTSGKDYEKMQEEGFSPMHMEAHTIVTVTDRIKVAMAKGGADISRMGGISDAKLEAMSDSAGQKVQLEYALENADLPVEEDTLAAGQIAMTKTQEMDGRLSLGAACYMLKMTCLRLLIMSIRRIFPVERKVGWQTTWRLCQKDLQGQLETMLTDAGMEASDENLTYCNYLIKNQIPVTTENLTYMAKLLELPLDQESGATAERIADAVAEGKEPGDAMLLSDYSLMGQAKRSVCETDERTGCDHKHETDAGSKASDECGGELQSFEKGHCDGYHVDRGDGRCPQVFGRRICKADAFRG